MQHTGTAGAQRRRVAAGVDAVAAGFHAVHGHVTVVQERVEQADGIGAPAHAGDQGVRQLAGLLEALLARLAADHGLEVAHQHRVRVRPGHGADDVEGIVHVGDPVAHRLVHGVLEGARTGGHRHHVGAQQLHAIDVEALAADVFLAHEHVALQAQARGHGGRGHAVLAGAGFRDHPLLAHVLGEQRLADGVVHLVGAGVVEILALEPDAGAAELFGPALGQIQRRGPAHVMGQVVVEIRLELGIVLEAPVHDIQLVEGGHQGFGDEASAEASEMTVLIGKCLVIGPTAFRRLCHRMLLVMVPASLNKGVSRAPRV